MQIDNELQCRTTQFTTFVNPLNVTVCIKIPLSKATKTDKKLLIPTFYPLLGTHIILAEKRPLTPFGG
jgi:hypothetical protein